MPQIEAHACQEYLEGFQQIGLRTDLIPNLAEVNQRLRPRSGWRATPVSGFLPPDAFFAMLAARQFPTTTWLRSRESLEYIPEPDIFHDVFGHVPMHAHPVFADFLQHYGAVCAALTDKEALEKMGRLFWFTVEFGVIRQQGGYRLYGSGLISSQGESTYVIEGGPEIRDFDVDQVLNQEFSTSEMQPVLYAVESFDQIYEATYQAERQLCQGKHVGHIGLIDRAVNARIFFKLSRAMVHNFCIRGATLPRIHFQQQLAALKDKLLAMAALSQQAVISSVDAYLQRDAGLCQYVRENETAINAAQREVDEMAYELLAQEQPMAIDLRFILAVIKINGDLERVGDQSMSIAIRTQELLEYPAVELPVDIASMGEHASRMVRSAIQALLDADAQFADSVVVMDDEIDEMNRVARAELMKVMETAAGDQPAGIERDHHRARPGAHCRPRHQYLPGRDLLDPRRRHPAPGK